MAEMAASREARSAAFSAIQSWQQANPGQDLPIDMEARLTATQNEYRYATRQFQDAHKQWEQTEEGLERTSLGIAQAAGLSDRDGEEQFRLATRALFDLDEQARALQEAGQPVPADLKKERKEARATQQAALRAAAAPFYDHIAATVNRNPEKFGGVYLDGQDVNLTIPAHAAAALDTFKALRRDGSLVRADEATTLAHRLSAASAERAMRMHLYGKAAAEEPTDDHHSLDPSREEYIRRITNPDTQRVYTFGEMHGDKKKQADMVKAGMTVTVAHRDEAAENHEASGGLLTSGQMREMDDFARPAAGFFGVAETPAGTVRGSKV
jgi:hypothetical protein